jgi:hypothetical protein
MALLFSILVLPVLSLALLLGVELGGVLSSIRSLEAGLDRIALMVGHHLPDMVTAKQSAISEINGFVSRNRGSCRELKPTVSDVNGGIGLNVICRYVPRFASFIGFSDLGLDFRAYSEVTKSPTDTTILLDRSTYLAPERSSLWGDDPPSDYFAQKFANHGDAKYHSQLCNNFVLRNLKLFALALINKNQSSADTNLSRYGIGVFPGDASSLILAGGQTPYLSILKNLNNPQANDNRYNGEVVSSYDCYQQMYFEVSRSDLYGLPVLAHNDPIGVSSLLWSLPAVHGSSRHYDDTWSSIMEGIRHSVGGTATSDFFGNDRQINLVVVAGDVPHLNGDPFPWPSGGWPEGDIEELRTIIAGGKRLELTYIIYAPARHGVDTAEIVNRSLEFERAMATLSKSIGGRFATLVKVYTDEQTLFGEGLSLVRRNAGRITLRRLQ